jgi:hypothetical protein
MESLTEEEKKKESLRQVEERANRLREEAQEVTIIHP